VKIKGVKTVRMFVTLVFLSLGALPVAAQVTTGSSSSTSPTTKKAGDDIPFTLEKNMNEFGVWGGGSFVSPELAGKAADVKSGIVGLRYARIFAVNGDVAFKYTIDAIPMVALSFRRSELVPSGSGSSSLVVQTTHPTVYGFGVAPAGLQVNFRRRERIQPFVNLSGGLLYFAEAIPDRGGTQFNFSADLGVGLEFLIASKRAWTLGYRYHHISNAYRGQVNPGFDSNLIYAGFSFFK
jgi:hypothetical protein